MNKLLTWIRQFESYKDITEKELVSLEILDLPNNNITEIPKELSELSNLKRLYLYRNNITEIPKELSKLTNLQILYLDSKEYKIYDLSLVPFLEEHGIKYKYCKYMKTPLYELLNGET